MLGSKWPANTYNTEKNSLAVNVLQIVFMEQLFQSILGPVVRKTVNANLGLEFNQGSCFSC